MNFAISVVWDSIRPDGHEAEWFRMVWFSAYIPRHAFNIRLIMSRKLKTRDLLKKWDVNDSTNLNLLHCSSCKSIHDSHEHLFFECPFPLKVWKLVLKRADLHHVPSNLEDIASWLLHLSSKRSVDSIVSRLVFEARQHTLFGKREITDCMPKTKGRKNIFATLSLKLLT
uniref:Reverse transcriptase zinc-binding domain-containing protein n=1 Tax=Tanacetum cinerariifolium TaxID=118510 RepID=A0A699GPH6_TANCI|nr:hypothetical protein [Tanacetum cinerariifolium]